MAKERRLELISEIEKIRKSKVVCYLTGDRRGFETRIHPEVHTMLYDHLQKISHAETIDLYLYSTGGVTMAAWSIVNLIREFCNKMSVIIPFKAFSTATLISLGADEIIMGKLGQIGPVDPTVTMPFNPPAPSNRPGEVLPISVEEVSSFIDFAKDEKYIGIKSESALVDVLKQLTEKVHPLALGSVYRAIEQIRMLASKLLGFHMSPDEEEKEIEKIIGALTKRLYSHDYIISRKEAKNEIKLNVKDVENVDKDFEKLVYDLFKEYEQEMCLTNPFSPEILLGTQNECRETFFRAFIESQSRTDTYITEKEFKRIQQTSPTVSVPQVVIQERIIKEGWEQI